MYDDVSVRRMNLLFQITFEDCVSCSVDEWVHAWVDECKQGEDNVDIAW